MSSSSPVVNYAVKGGDWNLLLASLILYRGYIIQTRLYTSHAIPIYSNHIQNNVQR